MELDILSDCRAVCLKAGIDGSIVNRVIAELRRTHGGCSEYICATDRDDRDQIIRESLNAGLPAVAIAKNLRCSVATIRRRKSAWLK